MLCRHKGSRKIKRTYIQKLSVMQFVATGIYHHFGLLKDIELNLPDNVKDDQIELVVGMDGLPLYKSNPNNYGYF